MIKELAMFVGPALVRNAEGWLRTSLEDGKIQAYEWKQLCITVVRVASLQLAVFLSLNGVVHLEGSEEQLAMLAAGGAAFVLDKILCALKKRNA